MVGPRYARIALTALVYVATAAAVTPPKDALGFNLGDDYQVANYTQLEKYWKKLAAESDRMKLVDIGATAEGRRQYMAIVSSPENLKNLDRYKDIARRLALAEGLTEDQAHALAREGKAVVWIDGGLHANETVGSQQLMEMVYQMVSRNDPETMRLLDDTIQLYVQANPDGQELVANWYMREADPAKRSLNGLPRLYQKYVGHDDNRDFFLSAMPETTNMNRQLFLEWFPQIVYNHHQTGPAGAVVFIPPFRDPFNYNLDPLIPLGIEMVGSAMHSRLVAEGKGGSAMRSGSTYSNLVERRPAHDCVLPQYDRDPDGDHRRPHAGRYSAGCRQAVAAGRRAAAHRAAEVALSPVDRLRHQPEPGDSGLRVALSRDAAVQHLPHGDELDREGQPG